MYGKDQAVVSLLGRRKLLMLMGGGIAALAPGCGPGMTNTKYTPQTIAGCLVSPDMVEGPYFVDEKLERSDIRTDPSDGSVKEGVPLVLNLSVMQVASDSCKPLAGATVDVWHCDALGSYSDVKDNSDGKTDSTGKKFLRGYQTTDESGKVRFQTIYPGWYQGRTVHIHYKVRTNPKSENGHEFTSQLHFDEAINEQVLARAPYSQRTGRDTTNATDGIFRGGGPQSIPQMTGDVSSFDASYTISFLMA